MIYPIVIYGDYVLRKACEPVPADYPDLKKLIGDMFATLGEAGGVGLAAPQIGKSIRLVVIDADPVAEAFPECAGRKFVLLNPEIEILDGEKVSRAEGCLSLPGVSENVPRVEHIHLRWLDEDMQPHEEEISGFLARIVQHECDHLEGKVFTDHISAIRKQLIRRKLNDIVTGRVAVDYPVRFAPVAKRR